MFADRYFPKHGNDIPPSNAPWFVAETHVFVPGAAETNVFVPGMAEYNMKSS